MFYDKVVSLCNSKGVSPSKLADSLKLGRSNVTNWKNGAIPQNRTIKKIADYFNVEIEYFTEDVETTTNQPLPSNAHPVSSEVMSVPIIGRIPAGLPVVAIENIEGYEVVPL